MQYSTTLSALLDFCEENPSVTCFPHKGPAMQSFDICVEVSLNKLRPNIQIAGNMTRMWEAAIPSMCSDSARGHLELTWVDEQPYACMYIHHNILPSNKGKLSYPEAKTKISNDMAKFDYFQAAHWRVLD